MMISVASDAICYNQYMDKGKDLLFELDGRMPALRYSLPLALQHLVAMIVGCVTPAIIISSTAGLDSQQSILLIQSSLICASLSTLLQLFGIKGICGARLPLIMGVSFAYLATMTDIAGKFGLAEIFGAQIAGGLTAMIIGLFAKKLFRFFPPLITGTVVFTIGLSLYPTAIEYMAGGSSSPAFGSWQNWLTAIFTLVVVTTLNHFGKGMVKLASILIGIAAGYIFSSIFGMVDVSAVADASLFSLPQIAPFGIRFELASCLAFSLLFAINAVQAIGDMSATTIGGMNREASGDELRGGIIGFGVSNLFSALLGGLPNATYSQNVGIVSSTKVVNRKVLAITALMLLSAGLIPKFSAILTTIPQSVLGGATVSVFASIAMTGMKLVSMQPMSYRNTSIVGLSAALGMGISMVSEALSQFPEWVTMVFASSPVVVSALVAIILNIILPKEESDSIKS